MKAQAKGKKRRPNPVTMAEVDQFLGSPVARHYFTFSESNVKRRLIRMLVFLRTEVDRLQHQATAPESGPQEAVIRQWAQRVSKRPFG
jgi:hypothetical protein